MMTDFIPLRNRTGVLASDFMHTLNGRGLVIWGAGVLGRCLMKQLAIYAEPEQTLAFTDSNSDKAGVMIDSKPVLSLAEAIHRTCSGVTFIVIALAGHIKFATRHLLDAGLVTSVDFESYLKLSRPEAIVQVVGHASDEKTLCMSPDIYRSILSKLKADVPDLFHVDLSGWGDPLDHPAIEVIVEMTRAIVPCTLTTLLNADATAIERALRAEPTQFVVAVDGNRDESFFNRLRYIAELNSQLSGCTEIRVKYKRFRDNYEGFDALRTRCNELGLKLVVEIGYIDPYDTTLELCKTDTFDNADTMRLVWSLREALDWARADRECPCLCQRIFPVINPDTSVCVCHLYARPRLHDNYLAIDFESLQDLRRDTVQCRICQYYALHRLDVDVLQSRYAIQLIHTPEDLHA